MKLIDVNEALEKLCEYCCCGCFEHCEERCVEFRNINNLAAVEVVRGRWKQARYTEAPLYLCSKCDKPEYTQHNYCPNCGAKMGEKVEHYKGEE